MWIMKNKESRLKNIDSVTVKPNDKTLLVSIMSPMMIESNY